MQDLAERLLQLDAALDAGLDVTPAEVAETLRAVAADALELASEIERGSDA